MVWNQCCYYRELIMYTVCLKNLHTPVQMSGLCDVKMKGKLHKLSCFYFKISSYELMCSLAHLDMNCLNSSSVILTGYLLCMALFKIDVWLDLDLDAVDLDWVQSIPLLIGRCPSGLFSCWKVKFLFILNFLAEA